LKGEWQNKNPIIIVDKKKILKLQKLQCGATFIITKKKRCKLGWLVGPKKQVQMEFETAMWMDNPKFF
jgi:hypothetical protein